MYNNNALNIYQEKSISTASSQKLLLKLYEGAIKFCKFSEIAIDEKNIESRCKYLLKVQDIIKELALTLNKEAGEISEQLLSLYGYMENQLIQANIRNDKARVIEVRQMLEELLDAWNQIIR